MAALAPGRHVRFLPGFNRRGTADGVRGMSIDFVLADDYAAAHFTVLTHWVPGEVGWNNRGLVGVLPAYGADFGYHCREQQYAEQAHHLECDLVDGRCFYTSSGMEADELFKDFVVNGDEVVWQALTATLTRLRYPHIDNVIVLPS